MPRAPFHPIAVLLVLAAACAPPPAAPAPDPAAPTPPTTAELAAVARAHITPEAAFAHVAFLASDEMLGRDTPGPELERAAAYIAREWEEAGIEPAGDEGGWFQRWPFLRSVLVAEESHAGYRIDGTETRWEYAREYFVIPGPDTPVEGTPVYAPSPAVAAAGLPDGAAGAPLLVSLPDGLGEDLALAVQAAFQAGSSGIAFIMDEETDAAAVHQIAEALEAGAAGMFPLPAIGVRPDRGDELLRSAGVEPRGARDPPGEARILDGVTLSLRSTFRERRDEPPNVVGMVRGSDPELAHSYLVLTAHFDHVGVGPPDETGDTIYSGADDNASGTTTLLLMARAMAALPQPPARSVVFLAVSGEEKGLLGSEHWAGSPTVPAEGIVANLNFDMVSRNHPDTVYAIGEEYTELGERARRVAADHPEVGLVVAPDPTPEEQSFLRSDHFSFARREIPALMLTTGLHDDYHSPSDTPDRIDPDKLARVARLGFLLAYRVADDPETPAWTEAGRALLRTLSGPDSP